jgi:hypothetical protein
MSQPSLRESLRQRALRGMLESAIFDWKGAIIVALTLLLSVFAPRILPGWQWWYWVIGGAVAWGALIASMLTDPAFGAQVVADMLRQELDPGRLQNKETQAKINQALQYRQRIAEAFARARTNILPDDLKGLENQIDEWLAHMYTLAERIDTYESEAIIQRDQRTVPQAIQNLQAQLKTERNPAVIEQIQQTLQAKQQQLNSLKMLEGTIHKAQLQMDSTVTALGTVYSQLLLVGVKDIDSGRARRMREEVTEQVNQLQDLVSSVDEVYAHRA